MQIAPPGAIRMKEQDDGELDNRIAPAGFTVEGLDGSPHDQRHQPQRITRRMIARALTSNTTIASSAAGGITLPFAAPRVPAHRDERSLTCSPRSHPARDTSEP
jgi:hypothetical protein